MATRKQQFQLGYNESALFPDNCQREMCSPGGGFSSDQENWMTLKWKMILGNRGVFKTQSNIQDGTFFENSG